MRTPILAALATALVLTGCDNPVTQVAKKIKEEADNAASQVAVISPGGLNNGDQGAALTAREDRFKGGEF